MYIYIYIERERDLFIDSLCICHYLLAGGRGGGLRGRLGRHALLLGLGGVGQRVLAQVHLFTQERRKRNEERTKEKKNFIKE